MPPGYWLKQSLAHASSTQLFRQPKRALQSWFAKQASTSALHGPLSAQLWHVLQLPSSHVTLPVALLDTLVGPVAAEMLDCVLEIAVEAVTLATDEAAFAPPVPSPVPSSSEPPSP
jgi:hypothetical protein